MTFGSAKFQVDAKKGEKGWRVGPKHPVDVKGGRSEYIDGP